MQNCKKTNLTYDIIWVNNRKKLLSYLSKKDNEKYMKLIKELNIRG